MKVTSWTVRISLTTIARRPRNIVVRSIFTSHSTEPGVYGTVLSSESIFVIVLLRLNFEMPKEESDGSALGALLAPSAGLFAGEGINEP